MIERLLMTAAIVLLAVSVYAFARGLHMMQISRFMPVRNYPTVLYFRSESCGPCVAQWRYLEQIRADFAGKIAIEKIDADVDYDKAAQYGVFTVPTTMIVDPSGTVRHINYGLTDARRLAHQLRGLEIQAPQVA